MLWMDRLKGWSQLVDWDPVPSHVSRGIPGVEQQHSQLQSSRLDMFLTRVRPQSNLALPIVSENRMVDEKGRDWYGTVLSVVVNDYYENGGSKGSHDPGVVVARIRLDFHLLLEQLLHPQQQSPLNPCRYMVEFHSMLLLNE
jgi:hypothetical protein